MIQNTGKVPTPSSNLEFRPRQEPDARCNARYDIFAYLFMIGWGRKIVPSEERGTGFGLTVRLHELHRTPQVPNCRDNTACIPLSNMVN